MFRGTVAWESAECKCDHVLSFLKNSQALHFLIYETPTLSMPGNIHPLGSNPSFQPRICSRPCLWPWCSLFQFHWTPDFLKVDLRMCCSHCLDSFPTVSHLVHFHCIILVTSLLWMLCSCLQVESVALSLTCASLGHTGTHVPVSPLSAGLVLCVCPVGPARMVRTHLWFHVHLAPGIWGMCDS